MEIIQTDKEKGIALIKENNHITTQRIEDIPEEEIKIQKPKKKTTQKKKTNTQKKTTNKKTNKKEEE